MFPSARNSVRRNGENGDDGHHSNNHTTIPIPVGVTLHNFILLQQQQQSNGDVNDESVVKENGENDTSDSPPKTQQKESSSRFFHPQHSASLLPKLHLEILVGKDDSGEETVVYKQTLPHRSVHPSWEHLDEQLEIPNKCWWKDHEVYTSMRLRMSIIRDENERIKENGNAKSTSQDTTIFLLEAPLHPSLLQRMDLQKLSSAASQGGNDSDDDLFSSSSLPPLPPNSLLVHYSDGSIRCLPHLYQLLCDEYKHLQQNKQEVEDFDRFENDVFKTLDGVQSTPQRRERTASSLLDQEEGGIQPSPSEDSHEKDTILEHLQQAQNQEDLAEQIVKAQSKTQQAFPSTKEDAAAEDFAHQNELLRQLIEQEEQLLEQETLCLNEEQADLKEVMQQLQELDHEAKLMQGEVRNQVALWRKDEIVKQAHGIKLLRDLRVIYPITLETVATTASSSMALSFIGGTNSTKGTPGGYLIRGLRLPVDIYTTTVPEEEINASLGYCVHLVFMIAKYLTIQLRHRVFCNSSRSAIQQDGVGVFPLFLGRMVARSLELEQVDRGARLLGANVNCILMHLDMPKSLHSQHILARLKAILQFVSDGELDSNQGAYNVK